MNKKNNRKGFTIVELVIVIAVIAILATVLVPTFSGIITKANESKVLQTLKNEYTEYTIKEGADGEFENTIIIKYNDKYYTFVNGSNAVTETTPAANAAYWDAANNAMATYSAG